MLQQFNSKTSKQTGAQPKTQRGKGIVKGNPTLCLMCGKSIRQTDDWVKLTSPKDPLYGSYSIVVHERCGQVR